MTDNLCDFSFGAASVSAVIGNFRHNLVSGHGALGTFQGNKNILRYFSGIRHHKAEVFGTLKGTDHFCNTTFQYVCDFNLRTPSFGVW